MSCILCPSGAVEGNALGGPTVFKTLYNQCDKKRLHHHCPCAASDVY